MIDLHSHILPGVDDGSADVAESQALLRLSARQGVKKIAATPHFYPQQDEPERFLARRQAAYGQLEQCTGDFPEIYLGAEVAYFAGMCRSQTLTELQIGSTGLLLVEMPFDTWTDRVVKEICQIKNCCGLTPVLAHVDRYRKLGQLPRYREQLLAEGVLFQCNAAAFLKGKWALRLLKKGQIHFLGSDCHNMSTRPPKLDQAIGCIRTQLGTDALAELDDIADMFFQ